MKSRITKEKALKELDRWLIVHGFTGWITKLKFLSKKEIKRKFGEQDVDNAGMEFDTDTFCATIYITKGCSEDSFSNDVCHEIGHLVIDEVDEAFEHLYDKYKVGKEDKKLCANSIEKVINRYRNIIVKHIKK